MYKILIIEDNLFIREELCVFLTGNGYQCSTIENFDENIVSEIIKEKSDLILLDVCLPFFDGYNICRELRAVIDTPIIIVTSKNSVTDELFGMNCGADDFITKPYNTQVLLARISAVLNRTYGMKDNIIKNYKGLTFDISKSLVTSHGKSVELTKNESRILQILINNRGKIVSRDRIIQFIWESDDFIDENTLTVNINRLRKKLSEIGLDNFLLTKRGQGYLI